MNTIQKAKNQANAIVQDAVEKRVAELMDTPEFEALKARVEQFENDPYCNKSVRQLDEFGALESVMELQLDTFSDEDSEVIDELLKECSEVIFFFQSQYSQGKHEWTMSHSLGEPVIVNLSDPRDCYAIHSIELSLKVDYSELIGKDDSEKLHHAKLLIEQAMRKAGIYPNIVEVDSYGQVIRELKGLGTLEDSEIEKQLVEIEVK